MYVCIYLFIFGHALWHVGSLFPDQGSNLHLLHWKLIVLTTGPPGRVPSFFIFKFAFLVRVIVRIKGRQWMWNNVKQHRVPRRNASPAQGVSHAPRLHS